VFVMMENPSRATFPHRCTVRGKGRLTAGRLTEAG